MTKSAKEMRLAVKADLPKKTDVTLAEWATLVRISAPHGTKREQEEWLCHEYGLGKTQAAVILDAARGKDLRA